MDSRELYYYINMVHCATSFTSVPCFFAIGFTDIFGFTRVCFRVGFSISRIGSGLFQGVLVTTQGRFKISAGVRYGLSRVDLVLLWDFFRHGFGLFRVGLGRLKGFARICFT